MPSRVPPGGIEDQLIPVGYCFSSSGVMYGLSGPTGSGVVIGHPVSCCPYPGGMTETALPASTELAGVERLIVPHAEIVVLSWLPQASPAMIRVDANLRASALAPGALPPDQRAALFATAQTVIRAVEEAGYKLNAPPQIIIAGSITQVDSTEF